MVVDGERARHARAAWDLRYSGAEYLYGTAPNAFLTRVAGRFDRGSRVLCVADGEGRNSVWLAAAGYRVTAFDSSPRAVTKARALAAERHTVVGYNVAAVEDWNWSAAPYDAVVAVFVQFADPPLREWLFRRMAAAVRPGGYLALHGYSVRQAGYGTGGPPDPAHLYTPGLLFDAFPGFDVLQLEDYDAEIAEGAGHVGRSALIDFLARRSPAGGGSSAIGREPVPAMA